MKLFKKNIDKKDILIIGGGGREHAIAVALKKSPSVGKIYCLPGNAGIEEIAECDSSISATDLDKIIAFVESHPNIYLTVVAPDDPLAMGLVDKLNEKGFRAFGPTAKAAALEASKVFSKGFMKRNGIPTAGYESFSDLNSALDYIKNSKFPIVIKADGLALGKGVSICNNLTEAETALKDCLSGKAFGNAGKSVVIEEFLTGFEVSVLAFSDGKTLVPMTSAEDNKRVYDGDKGPNTGGMGAISPALKFTKDIEKKAIETIYKPTMQGLKKEGIEFKGVIYFGLIVDNTGTPKVIEYNARFGDPETQVVLPKLKSCLLEIFDACVNGNLKSSLVKFSKDTTICVCLASGGYPLQYEKGKVIRVGEIPQDVFVYHAGTSYKDNCLVTNGGRVIGVSATAKDLNSAREKAYNAIKNISFDGMHYRKDIGNK